jgi:hypothetical protein
MQIKHPIRLFCLAILAVCFSTHAVPPAVHAGPPHLVYLPLGWKSCPGKCYFVSSSGGDDANPGTNQAQPFKSLARVNSLGLGPKDQVFFKCGDTWRGEVLSVTHSGQTGSPITYTSYPERCPNQPRIDGTQPLTGWSQQSPNLYFADLGGGENAVRFKDLSGANTGINQLFRAGARLPMGRWPNISDPNFDQGYSAVDAQPAGNQLSDAQLPANFTGATIHLKVIRWSMINRNIVGQNGTTLTLNTPQGVGIIPAPGGVISSITISTRSTARGSGTTTKSNAGFIFTPPLIPTGPRSKPRSF